MPTKTPLSWIFVLIGIAAIVAAIILTSPRGPLVAPSSEEEVGGLPASREDTFAEMLRTGPNAIYVDTQAAGAERVIIGDVRMEKAGFVVIHADDGGVPGRMIGVSDFQGTGIMTSPFVVGLDEALVHGQVYYAVLYADDGDGEFDAETDVQIVDAQNNVILMSFEAQEGAEPSSDATLL